MTHLEKAKSWYDSQPLIFRDTYSESVALLFATFLDEASDKECCETGGKTGHSGYFSSEHPTPTGKRECCDMCFRDIKNPYCAFRRCPCHDSPTPTSQSTTKEVECGKTLPTGYKCASELPCPLHTPHVQPQKISELVEGIKHQDGLMSDDYRCRLHDLEKKLNECVREINRINANLQNNE